ncbi:MAG: DEAD/DEAH box helicase [Bacteroidia bacterium]|nr:DEAD/DEAH box helicase [Bacteroidia bacterium]
MTFQELGLEPMLLKAVTEMGFENPTPIQEQTIPQLKDKSTDMVALAQTGTGKTAAFGLPLLMKLDLNSRFTQSLILAPTRELCVQISKDLINYSKFLNGLRVTAVYGGAPIMAQIRDIKAGSQVIVATPGRLIDLIERKAIDLSHVDVVVLDEADEMLNMGFKDDLDQILSNTPPTKNTWLFSATMPREVERIASKYMESPLEISVGKKNQGAENIQHIYYTVNQRDRYAALKRIADFYPDIFGIVFCRTKAETQDVADQLIKDGYNADALHGDLSQAQRDLVMKRFRSHTLQMLVATDVAARGIDVNNVTHVINYNLPEEAENYTHRSGRTGRAGKTGIAIAIVTPREVNKIRDIERIIQNTFTKADVPDGVAVCEKQLFHLVNKLHTVEVKDEEIENYLPKIYEELKDLSKEELIKRFISEEFNRFYAYYQNSQDLNIGNDGGNNGKTTRFFINMGQLDGFNRNSIKDFLVEISGLNARLIFNIDVKNSFSFFETENKCVDEFLALNKKGIEFNARVISFEVSKAKPSGGYGEKRSYGGGSREDGRRSYGGGERKSYGGGSREGGERRSYGGGERKSYGGGESRSYSGGGERRSSFGGNKEGGERKPFNREGGNGGGERRSFDKPTGERSFSGNREGAERRKRFTK